MAHFEMDRYVNALNNYLSIHKFKNDNIARNYFPVMNELKGKKILRVIESLYSSDSSFDNKRSEYIDDILYENVQLKMLNGIGFINYNGVGGLDISYNSVEHISYAKIDSKHYYMTICETVLQNDAELHIIHNCKIEVA